MQNDISQLVVPPWCDVSSMDLKRKGRMDLTNQKSENWNRDPQSKIEIQAIQIKMRSYNLGSSKSNQLTAMKLEVVAAPIEFITMGFDVSFD